MVALLIAPTPMMSGPSCLDSRRRPFAVARIDHALRARAAHRRKCGVGIRIPRRTKEYGSTYKPQLVTHCGKSDQLSLNRKPGGLRPVVDPELGEEVGDVGLDGPDANEQLVGDLAIGPSFDDQAQDLLLARRQSRGRFGGRFRRGGGAGNDGFRDLDCALKIEGLTRRPPGSEDRAIQPSAQRVQSAFVHVGPRWVNPHPVSAYQRRVRTEEANRRIDVTSRGGQHRGGRDPVQ